MSFVAVATVDEVSEELPLGIEVADRKVVIVRHEGTYHALDDSCSHAYVRLSQGDVYDGAIECYLHGTAFDLVTGKPRCLPATEPVAVFPCRVNGENIEVDLENPKSNQEQ